VNNCIALPRLLSEDNGNLKVNTAAETAKCYKSLHRCIEYGRALQYDGDEATSNVVFSMDTDFYMSLDPY